MDFKVITPKNKSSLLKAMKETRNFRFGAGYTDLLMEFRKQGPENLTVINLARMNDAVFHDIRKNANAIRVGALATAAQLEEDRLIRQYFPALRESASTLASEQIRQVATLGGNLCTASPSGDMACALVALQAVCEILAADGNLRQVPISYFFTGPRKTVLKKKEILRSILIPLIGKKTVLKSGFIKIGTRRSMECSVVSLAYHFHTRPDGTIEHAGIAIGAAAPTIRFTRSACDMLTGKKMGSMTQEEIHDLAGKVLSYAEPISDIRASAWYRKTVLSNITKSLFE